jgi:hypothetical protein
MSFNLLEIMQKFVTSVPDFFRPLTECKFPGRLHVVVVHPGLNALERVRRPLEVLVEVQGKSLVPVAVIVAEVDILRERFNNKD